jgi:hypothetical protein
MAQRIKVKTFYDLMSVTISNDESSAIVLFKKSQDELLISIYDLLLFD